MLFPAYTGRLGHRCGNQAVLESRNEHHQYGKANGSFGSKHPDPVATENSAIPTSIKGTQTRGEEEP